MYAQPQVVMAQPMMVAAPMVPMVDPNMMYHLSPACDAEVIYKAMKGVGTNDSLLSNVIVSRTREHLQLVKVSFKQQFGKTMEQWIKDDTSGDYKNLLLALIDDRAEFDAKAVYDAMKGLGTNDHRLVEIICTRTNYELETMKIAYQRLYGHSVEKDVKGDTSGDYERLLKTVLNAHRAETQPFTIDDVRRDAHAIYKAGEGRLGTDDDKFIEIFTTRSLPMIYAIAQEYEVQKGTSLIKAIEKETSGNYKRALTVIVTPREQYFAQEIFGSMEGLGTVDERLIRHLSYLSNYPPLFKAVYNAYHQKFNKKMEDDIKGDTSGWYLKTAIQLVKYRCL